jgi:hypothetical protein
MNGVTFFCGWDPEFLTCHSFLGDFGRTKSEGQNQARREDVKGVTVSRGPGRKMGPGNHESKRKIE